MFSRDGGVRTLSALLNRSILVLLLLKLTLRPVSWYCDIWVMSLTPYIVTQIFYLLSFFCLHRIHSLSRHNITVYGVCMCIGSRNKDTPNRHICKKKICVSRVKFKKTISQQPFVFPIELDLYKCLKLACWFLLFPI